MWHVTSELRADVSDRRRCLFHVTGTQSKRNVVFYLPVFNTSQQPADVLLEVTQQVLKFLLGMLFDMCAGNYKHAPVIIKWRLQVGLDCERKSLCCIRVCL